MLDIEICTIPHSSQRYPTAGDWQQSKKQLGKWCINVSRMSDWRYEILVAVHELVEMALCQNDGVPEDAVTQFDLLFETEREAGEHDEKVEPGLDPRAPYQIQHAYASLIEEQFAAALGVDWDAYNHEVESL